MSQIDEFEAHIDLLSEIIGQAYRLFDRFKIAPKSKNKKLFALITLNEITQKCESVVAMARADSWAGIVVVTRSAFESYADLLNCLSLGDDYADYMIWMSLKQQRSFFQTIGDDPDSKYYQSIDTHLKTKGGSVKKVIAETNQQLDELAKKLPDRFKDKNGRVVGRDRLRFEIAGIANEYNTLYRRLSASAHGRLSDMLDGIMVGDDINWPPAKPTEPPLVAADCLGAILLESCGRMATAYKKPDAPLKALVKKQAGLRRDLYG